METITEVLKLSKAFKNKLSRATNKNIEIVHTGKMKLKKMSILARIKASNAIFEEVEKMEKECKNESEFFYNNFECSIKIKFK